MLIKGAKRYAVYTSSCAYFCKLGTCRVMSGNVVCEGSRWSRLRPTDQPMFGYRICERADLLMRPRPETMSNRSTRSEFRKTCAGQMQRRRHSDAKVNRLI